MQVRVRTEFHAGLLVSIIECTDMNKKDHAVSASTTYLIRSLGGVWGVAITSSIVQNTLSLRLAEVFSGIPDKEKVSASHS